MEYSYLLELRLQSNKDAPIVGTRESLYLPFNPFNYFEVECKICFTYLIHIDATVLMQPQKNFSNIVDDVA